MLLHYCCGTTPVPGNLQKINKNKLPVVNGLALTVTDIKVFEQPDYKGNSGYFKSVNGKWVPPFPVTDCSFQIPQGKMVYIKRSFVEFPTEEVFIKSENKINLDNVIGIRSDEKLGVFVSFDGISTSIHNNDCRKVYGTVRVSLTESSPDRDSARSSMLRGPVPTGAHLITVMRQGEMSVFTPLNFADAASVTESFRSRFVYNNNPEPVVTHPA